MSMGGGSSMGNYGASNWGAPNWGANFQGSNTLPMNYSAPGWQQPSMSGDGFGWYGGQAQIPEGGMYNQMAQMMAGPSYAPPGSNWYSLPGGVSSNMGMGGGKGGSPYGMGGGKGGSPYGMGGGMGGGKGGSPYGFMSPPNSGQALGSYVGQTLGQNIPSSMYAPNGSSSGTLPNGWIPGETPTSIPGTPTQVSQPPPNAYGSPTGLAGALPGAQILSGKLAGLSPTQVGMMGGTNPGWNRNTNWNL